MTIRLWRRLFYRWRQKVMRAGVVARVSVTGTLSGAVMGYACIGTCQIDETKFSGVAYICDWSSDLM